MISYVMTAIICNNDYILQHKNIYHELLKDPVPKGEIGTLYLSKTTLYKKQNDKCWPSGKGALLYNNQVNYVTLKHLKIRLFTCKDIQNYYLSTCYLS